MRAREREGVRVCEREGVRVCVRVCVSFQHQKREREGAQDYSNYYQC